MARESTQRKFKEFHRKEIRAISSASCMIAVSNGLSSTPDNFIIEEAIKDSPRFRATVHQHVLYFNRLENRLNEMLRHLTAMMEYSRNYMQTFYKFTIAMNQLREESFSTSALSQTSFNALTDAYSSTVSLFKNYHDESTLVVYNKINNFIKQDLAKLATTRSHFDSMSSSMDDALLKNATISRGKPGEVAEYRNELTAVGTCFAHTSLDYVAQINLAHAKKDHIIIDALWSFVKETSSFFSRGHAVFDEWTASDDGGLADTITGLAANSKVVERKMQDIHSRVPKVSFDNEFVLFWRRCKQNVLPGFRH